MISCAAGGPPTRGGSALAPEKIREGDGTGSALRRQEREDSTDGGPGAGPYPKKPTAQGPGTPAEKTGGSRDMSQDPSYTARQPPGGVWE